MPVFLERFAIPALATALIGVIVLNPFKLDWQRQIALAIATIALAYFFGSTVHQFNQRNKTPPSAPVSALPETRPESLHASTTGSNSPVVQNNSGTVNITSHSTTVVSKPDEGISSAVALAQRPWLSLDVALVSGLDYDDKGWELGTRFYAQIQFRLKNSGKSPATDIDSSVAMIPFTLSYYRNEDVVNGVPIKGAVPTTGTNVKEEMERLFTSQDHISQVSMGGIHGMLAPEQETLGAWILNGDTPEFKKAKAERWAGNLLVVLCVTYGSTFNKQRYRIGKAFSIHKLARENIDGTGETVPRSELGFTPYPFGGSVAN